MQKTLKELREEKGLTQEEMAIELGYASKSGYNMLENGNTGISLKKAKQLADFFGVSVEDIFFRNEVQETATKQ